MRLRASKVEAIATAVEGELVGFLIWPVVVVIVIVVDGSSSSRWGRIE